MDPIHPIYISDSDFDSDVPNLRNIHESQDFRLALLGLNAETFASDSRFLPRMDHLPTPTSSSLPVHPNTTTSSSLKRPFTSAGSSSTFALPHAKIHPACASQNNHNIREYHTEDNGHNDGWPPAKRLKRSPTPQIPLPFTQRIKRQVKHENGEQPKDGFRSGIGDGVDHMQVDGEAYAGKATSLADPSRQSDHMAGFHAIFSRTTDHMGSGSGVAGKMPRSTDERILFREALKCLNACTVETEITKGLLSVSLLKHQKIALTWMLEREKGGVCFGGFLADDQGLGKTISMIALILMQRSAQDEFKSRKTSPVVKTEALDLMDQNVPSALAKLKPKAEGLDFEDLKDRNENDAGAPSTLKPMVEAINLEEDDDADQEDESDSKTNFSIGRGFKNKFNNKKPAAGTLVVCPASVLRQWARKLDEKVSKESELSVLIYHGSKRTRDPVELAEYDVVLTTYSIVAMEVPKVPEVATPKFGLTEKFTSCKPQKKSANGKDVKENKAGRSNENDDGKGKKGKKRRGYDPSERGTLAKVRWFRVILDEAHIIKNYWTKAGRACCSLRAQRRWCLSGTPIQNEIDELFSYFRFLRHEPFGDYKIFYHGVKSFLNRDSSRGYKRVQCVLKGMMLRRTKGTLIDGKPILTLPPKTVEMNEAVCSGEERAFYDELEAEYKSQFKSYADAGTVNQNYAMILVMLLRLRQACDHPVLVRRKKCEPVGIASLEKANSPPSQELRSLLRQLLNSSAICGVCSHPLENAVVTICGHVFCFECLSSRMTEEETVCPHDGCKKQVGPDGIFSKATLEKSLYNFTLSDKSENTGVPAALKNICSSKIKALFHILQPYHKTFVPKSEPTECLPWHGQTSSGNGCAGLQKTMPNKAIVFSQWTGMLDLVEDWIGDSIEYRRLDGTMSLDLRAEAVRDFNTKREVTVMFMSLKAGYMGLNMVAANHDPWWNPTTEDQAVDRAHRIGQSRSVTVTRLTVQDTIEDRILALQAKKRLVVASALGEDGSGVPTTRLTFDDLRDLFNARGY